MKRFFFVCLILSSLYAVSQPGNTPGIVINNNGDTLVGDINYREWTKNPSKIDFV